LEKIKYTLIEPAVIDEDHRAVLELSTEKFEFYFWLLFGAIFRVIFTLDFH
jgi:hypothetical protein